MEDIGPCQCSPSDRSAAHDAIGSIVVAKMGSADRTFLLLQIRSPSVSVRGKDVRQGTGVASQDTRMAAVTSYGRMSMGLRRSTIVRAKDHVSTDLGGEVVLPAFTAGEYSGRRDVGALPRRRHQNAVWFSYPHILWGDTLSPVPPRAEMLHGP
jgi:hypothetical protein